MRNRLFMRAKVAALRAAAPLLEPIYGGIASILALHRVVAPPPYPRVGFPRWIESTPAELVATIELFRARGYTFVSSDELCRTLARGRSRRSPKLAVITLDDGYLDNYRVAEPIFAAYGIPYTVYVATGFPDRTCAPWPQLLEQRLATSSQFGFSHRGQTYEWRIDTQAARQRAFAEAASQFHPLAASEARTLCERAFGVEQTRLAMDAHFLGWDMLRAMAGSGRATIGAHTLDHVALPALTESEARRQMAESKQRIERELDLEVRHFAYPFGECGAREARLAREVGFASAVTTRVANVFREHASHLYALPRVYTVFGSLAEPRDKPLFSDELALQLSGASPALANRGRRVVTLGTE